MNKEIGIMRFKKELQEKIKARVDKNQRDYLLREQLKVIRPEAQTAPTGKPPPKAFVFLRSEEADES